MIRECKFLDKSFHFLNKKLWDLSYLNNNMNKLQLPQAKLLYAVG